MLPSKIYDMMSRKSLAWGCFLSITALLVASMLTLRYNENITDFLPLKGDSATAMEAYREASGANNVYAIVSLRDRTANPEIFAEGVDILVENIINLDTTKLIKNIISNIDPTERFDEITQKLWAVMPFLLTDDDYDRIDSLLNTPEYIEQRVADNRQLLLMPTTGIVGSNLSYDPLGLFSPVMEAMNEQATSLKFNTWDGYILSPDNSRAFIVLETAHDPNDSGKNAPLVEMLNSAVTQTEAECPSVEITITGSPVIAVGNAERIKTDSLWSVIVAGILIIVLLIYVFRSCRNILLIFISVGWGWLFAMGGIALFYNSVSIIVVAIASIMLGIAVNYPLHLIDHLSDTTNRRQAMKTIIGPLVIGNITTVGAFLCLVPLKSPALHHLGLFASMLLVGTMIFVLVFLPHAVKHTATTRSVISLPKRIKTQRILPRGMVVALLTVLTLIFAWQGQYTSFDADLRNINYLTPQQQEQFDYLNNMMGADSPGGGVLYIATSAEDLDEALTLSEKCNAIADSICHIAPSNVERYVSSEATRKHRFERWRALASHGDEIAHRLEQAASRAGFTAEAFSPFIDMLGSDYELDDTEIISDLLGTFYYGSVNNRNGKCTITRCVAIENVPPDKISRLKENLPDGAVIFDADTIRSSLTSSLALDFNYIGVACGCIVFIFLWLSMGRIELAVTSFLPMAISWVWILGLMGMLDMRFNIVNIILATFIFGQGDDYTIFITEGLSYELAYGRRVITRYKSNIIVSALLMFAGIGTLAFAQHPAMRSLGQVTIVGMVSVVVMACYIPPLLFNFLTRHGDGTLRRRPLTFYKLLLNSVWHLQRLVVPGYRGIPGVHITVVEPQDFKPGKKVAVYNHASGLDKWLLRYLERRLGITFVQADEQGEKLFIGIVGAQELMRVDERFYSPGRVTLRLSTKALECGTIDVENAHDVVLERYLYKGIDVWRGARRRLKDLKRAGLSSLQAKGASAIEVTDEGNGEKALLTALLNPESLITAHVKGLENADLLKMAAKDLCTNIEITP